MIKPLNATLLLLSASLILFSGCTRYVDKPPFNKEYYEEKEYSPVHKVVTIKDASKEVSYLKKENKRLVAKIKSLSPYK